ncbi:MAG: GNAT family N-acetyltransferase [Methylomonas sp.]|nr:MAG: GNAT family N-acetyltransferase [Methylobacter sp.]PPD34403.1 MAG: GNAT family N-acetyltransferase [Methylomonas sp.]
MGPHYLSRFFAPKSVAIIGASERPNSVGFRLMQNMLDSGFKGKLYPVNPKHTTLSGLTAYPNLSAISDDPDLVVVATPAPTVPDIIRQCGEKNVSSAIIISAGFSELGAEGKHLQDNVLAIAHRFGIRLIGPNCLGVICPGSNLNASFADGVVKPGNLALLSQSGAICTAILDWAASRDIGFSNVISMGSAADIDFGEVLDYLTMDAKTTGILMYVEGIREARRFLSGLKVAARLKPVILIKAGRHDSGSKAAMSHTGALVGGDHVFDAAIARAGAVRVYSISELFSAARILAKNYHIKKNRLAIITNAGGPGVMCTDRAEDVGVALAELSEDCITALNKVLPLHWSHANPVDILGDATPERYQQVLEICLKEQEIDGILAILTPQAMTDPTEVAKRLIEAANLSKKPVMASWTGGARVQEGRELFDKSKIAHFTTPEVAVDAFSFLAKYHQNQILLRQIPSPVSDLPAFDFSGSRLIIERVLSEGRDVLTAQETKAILAACHISITQTISVRSSKDAIIAAETLGFPVALKINMAQFSHKSDIGGVKLNLKTAEEVAHVYSTLEAAIRQKYPEINEVGLSVEPMYVASGGRELMLGVARDPIFGPAISIGLGGTLVEILKDNQIALPPLNAYMAEQLISKSKAFRYLQAFRQLPPANMAALIDTLLKVSLMISELPEILELDINPLIVDENNAVAVDARLKVCTPHQLAPYSHMAIHPYPQNLTQTYLLANGANIVIRPIRPEDAYMEKDFVNQLSERSKYFRFMQALHELTPEMLVRFTQIDYDREMAFVATTDDPNLPNELGVGRYLINPDGQSAEFAIVVADSCQCMGVGSRIMKTLMQSAKAKNICFLEGEVLAINQPMLTFMLKLGFSSEPINDDLIRVTKDLRQ